MKVTFFSNYLNHLQTSFCDEMYNYLGDGFKFISTEPLPSERLLSGYQDCSGYVYNLNSYTDDLNYQKAMVLGLNSDIVIIGASPDIFIRERLLQKKITFRYSERFLKRGDWQILSPRYFIQYVRNHWVFSNKNTYMLCASGFAARDLNLIFAYPGRKYKWGYFTDVKELNIDDVIKNKPADKTEIVWAARFIEWKRPELAIELALVLKEKGYKFHISMIGDGELRESTKDKIEKLGLNEYVSILGSISNAEVRNYMLSANIFLFTSDRNEGWGVVLNEAMSSGCAIIAADKIGAVPFMIQNGDNGLVFKTNSLDHLVLQTEMLMHDKALQEELGKNAYLSMKNIWNPHIAAKNFMSVAEAKLQGKNVVIDSGPCSPA